jgi:hypothetical protein
MAVEQYLFKFVPIIDGFFFIAALLADAAAIAIFAKLTALHPKSIRSGFVLFGDGTAFWAWFWGGAARLVGAGCGDHGGIFYGKT